METKLKRLATPHKLKLVEDAAAVKELVVQEYEKLKADIIAPGFRKGHVPREVAERQAFFNRFTAYRDIFDILYKRAVALEGLEVVDAKEFEVIGPFEDDVPLTVQATVFLKPKVEKFDINEISVIKNVTAISEKMVDDQVRVVLDAKATFTDVSEPGYVPKSGDRLIIDFSGQVDGKTFSGGTARHFTFVVGQTKFIPSFEEQMVKMALGQTGAVNVRFPDDYHDKKLQGKDAIFTVTINKIESKSALAIEQAAAADGKTVDEYRAAIRNKLIEDYRRIDEENFESDVLSQCVLKAVTEPIPDSMIEWELANEWHQLLHRMGMSEDEFLKKNKNGKDVFYAQKRPRVEKALEVKTFLDHIVITQAITATKEEVQNFVRYRANTLNKSAEELQSILRNLEKDVNYHASETAVKHEKATKYLVDFVRARNLEKT